VAPNYVTIRTGKWSYELVVVNAEGRFLVGWASEKFQGMREEREGRGEGEGGQMEEISEEVLLA
jgi:hypothetical protein